MLNAANCSDIIINHLYYKVTRELLSTQLTITAKREELAYANGHEGLLGLGHTSLFSCAELLQFSSTLKFERGVVLRWLDTVFKKIKL